MNSIDIFLFDKFLFFDEFYLTKLVSLFIYYLLYISFNIKYYMNYLVPKKYYMNYKRAHKEK